MKSSNGRIDIRKKEAPDICNLFSMYDKIPANQCASYREPTMGIWDETTLSTVFFSQKNIDMVQNGIRSGVYTMSNGQYTIAPQDCDSLKVIMRSIFLQHATNLETDVTGQIYQLNKMVLDYCIKHVYSEAQSYMKYLRDVSTIAIPPAPPVMSSTNDRRTYKMPDWF